jgi:hypothetical protein
MRPLVLPPRERTRLVENTLAQFQTNLARSINRHFVQPLLKVWPKGMPFDVLATNEGYIS